MPTFNVLSRFNCQLSNLCFALIQCCFYLLTCFLLSSLGAQNPCFFQETLFPVLLWVQQLFNLLWFSCYIDSPVLPCVCPLFCCRHCFRWSYYKCFVQSCKMSALKDKKTSKYNSQFIHFLRVFSCGVHFSHLEVWIINGFFFVQLKLSLRQPQVRPSLTFKIILIISTKKSKLAMALLLYNPSLVNCLSHI